MGDSLNKRENWNGLIGFILAGAGSAVGLGNAGRPGEEVADPWYTGDFEATWQDLSQSLAGLLKALQ